LTSPTVEFLKELVVSLRSKPIKWINQFIEKDGLSLILKNLENGTDPIQEEMYISCLKSLMNNKVVKS
jgi:hypothetical protein